MVHYDGSMHFKITAIIDRLTEQGKIDLIHCLWEYNNLTNPEMIRVLKRVEELKEIFSPPVE